MKKPHYKINPVKANIKRKPVRHVYKAAMFLVILAFIGFLIVPNFYKSTETVEHVFVKEGELLISDSTGSPKIKLDIEIADNDYDRELGLMFRKEMKENRGMLFIFPREEMQSFWMKNTLISLDIIFINTEKQIVTIQRNAKPLDETSLPSSKPSQYVLEVNGGFSERHRIKEGDRISF